MKFKGHADIEKENAELNVGFNNSLYNPENDIKCLSNHSKVNENLFIQSFDHFKTRISNAEYKNETIASRMKKRKVLASKTNTREQKVSWSENSFAMSNISSMQSKNGFVPLVLENNLETAVLNLQENAYIEDERTAKSFSFYVLRGKFIIRRNGNEVLLKRDGVLVVNEGESFFCKGLAKNGNAGIVTYKIR